ncbi:MAG: NADH-quinone oxidoreductase subunit C [Clostridiales bacterium]|nr:NADH-quinone oxidoreductase subunit C [Clostridiales bacterium]
MQTNTKISITKDEIVPTAQKMRDEGRTLVMIHGHLDKEGRPVISYDYSLGAELACYEVVGEDTVPSIATIYSAAAEWPEREINELLGFTFEGLDTSERLFLPDSMLEGKGQIIVTPINVLKEKNGLL